MHEIVLTSGVLVNRRQARTYHLLESILGPGTTRSLDESTLSEDEPGTWRLTFNGDIWVFIYEDGATDLDALTDFLGLEPGDIARFETLPNGRVRAPHTA